MKTTMLDPMKWTWWRRPPVVLGLLVVTFVAGWSMRGGGRAPTTSSEVATHAADEAEAPLYYTCSMHPSVRLTDPNAKCPICFMDLVPVRASGGGLGSERQITLDADAVAAARVETSVVERFFPQAEVRLYGKVTYDETAVARLSAYFPGRIERLFVNYVGVPVAEGDHIAELYSPELLAAFAELRQVRLAQRDVEGMSEVVRNSSRGMLEAAREKLRLLGVSADQIAAAEEGSFTADRLTVFSPMRGVVTHLAVREGDYVGTGSPIATVADLGHLWLDLEAYESQLPLLRWGQRVHFTVEAHAGEQFEGSIAFIEPMVDDRTRTAAVRIAVDNVDGRLKPGMFASAVVQTRVGADGAVASDALAGKWVSPMHPTVVKDRPGTCDICGMDLVRAESLGVVGDPAAAIAPLVVPHRAVLYTGVRSVVYVEVPDAASPTYEGREIELGPRAGDFVVVRDGLREGERVVSNGAFRIDSAMQILARPSMMMPPAESAGGDGGAFHDLPAEFSSDLRGVLDSYLAAQEALARDEEAKARDAVAKVATAASAVRTTGLTGEALATWRRLALRLSSGTETPDLPALRQRFEELSTAAIELEGRFGHVGGDTLWHAYCPMAFDNRGAEWLQRTETIDNPYFGAAMLRCGEIRGRHEARDGSEGHGAAGSATEHRHD